MKDEGLMLEDIEASKVESFRVKPPRSKDLQVVVPLVEDNVKGPHTIFRILQHKTKTEILTVLKQFRTAECMFLSQWVQYSDGVIRYLNPEPTTTKEEYELCPNPEQSLISNQVALTDAERTVLVFSIGPHPNDTADTESLCVFRVVAVDSHATVAEAADVTTYTTVLTVMVSPSEDTNPDSPWFMVIWMSSPICWNSFQQR